MALTDVFIRKLVRETHPLRLMLHRLSVYNRVLELLDNGFMDSIALTWRQHAQSRKTDSLTKSSTVHAFFLNTTGVL